MTRKHYLLAAALLIAGGALGYLAALQLGPGPEPAPAAGREGKGEPLFYRNPMNPEITSPTPAKDEMGMDYIPVYAGDEGAAGPPGTVLIDPVTLQNIAVRTAPAEMKQVSHAVRAPARIAYDETRLARINARTQGWVERQYVQRAGDFVKAGQPLLALYSPELVTSQKEYLLALEALEKQKDSPYPDIREGARELARLTRRRLELLEVPESEIRALEQTRHVKETVTVASPVAGTVLAVGVREGQHVMPQSELYRLAELSQVWVIADVFEYELPWVSEGAQAAFTLESLPGRTFEGTVDYIYPYLNPQTRTVQVRIVADNADLALKPDAFADVTIRSERREHGVFVPAEAVIRTGLRKTVFVQAGEGRFEPRRVETGVASGTEVQIVEGLAAGERVVTSGQFLIDSESRLNEALSKMTPGAKPAKNEPEMQEHKHD